MIATFNYRGEVGGRFGVVLGLVQFNIWLDLNFCFFFLCPPEELLSCFYCVIFFSWFVGSGLEGEGFMTIRTWEKKKR